MPLCMRASCALLTAIPRLPAVTVCCVKPPNRAPARFRSLSLYPTRLSHFLFSKRFLEVPYMRSNRASLPLRARKELSQWERTKRISSSLPRIKPAAARKAADESENVPHSYRVSGRFFLTTGVIGCIIYKYVISARRFSGGSDERRHQRHKHKLH